MQTIVTHWQVPIISAAPTIIARTLADAPHAIEALQHTPVSVAGYFSYELAHLFEKLTLRATNDLQLPLIAFAPENAHPPGWRLKSPHQVPINPASLISRSFDRDAFIHAVDKTIDYIRAGDIFQANVAQRFTFNTDASPHEVFLRLQQLNPARYGALLDFGDHAIISNSPELFLDVSFLPDGRRKIVTRPIKGTRPLGVGMYEALRDSEKDKAELAMIVDLQRNDLGRVCEVGSVVVTEPRVIEKHPTLYHGVATIEGILRPGVTLYDILRATFPCGSITGCPKIRAMQIIDELEPVTRGPYCGAVGWIHPDGTLQLNVAIRTIVMQNNLAHVSVGAGIVADSVPEDEYDETLVKAQAMFAALNAAQTSDPK